VLAKRKSKLRVAWALHAATALVAVAVTAGVIYATRPKPVIIRSSLLAPDKTRFDAESGAMALSPEGTRIAFAAYGEAKKRMPWVRPLNALSAQPLAGTDGASFPFWSPDSRFIGFFSGGKLKKIDANGGPPQALCDASQGRGGCWIEGGTILFSPSPTDPMFKVASAGGTPVKVTELDLKKGETSHRHPSILPDGVHFIFLIEAHPPNGSAGDGFSLAIGSLESKQYTHLLDTKSSARDSKSGHILFLRDRTLLEQRFDAKKLELVGEPQPVAENMSRTNRWETTFSVSDTGLLAFQSGLASEASQVVWIDRDGKDLGAVGKPADIRGIALSHDGTRVAASILDPKTQTLDIWVLDIERGTSTRLTFDAEDDGYPVWSMDDRYVYFLSRRQGSGDVFRKASDGTGTDELVFGDSSQNILTSLTADGGTAAIISNLVGKTAWDISLLNLADGKSRVFLATPFSELTPMLSRDGRWLAYFSNETGRNEIYVQSLQAGGGKWQISTDGGSRPRWVRDDRELVWLSPDDKLMVVDVQFAPKFAPSVPRQLLDPRLRALVGYQFDFSRDGSRVLVNRSIEQPVVVPVTLVQNWTQALEK